MPHGYLRARGCRDEDAPEARQGFLLNHLITELLPPREGGYRFSNSDPVTGQAAWYDLRVSVSKAPPAEVHETWPRYEAVGALPGVKAPVSLSFGQEFRDGRG